MYRQISQTFACVADHRYPPVTEIPQSLHHVQGVSVITFHFTNTFGFAVSSSSIWKLTRMHFRVSASHPRRALIQPADVLPLALEFGNFGSNAAWPACPTTQQ